MNRLLRRALTIGFLAGALFHVASLVKPDLGSPSPLWRHALFVAINLFFAAAMRKPPRWLIVPAAILIVQQACGHGHDLIAGLHAGHLDIQSLVSLAVLPLLGIVALDAFTDRSRP